MIFSKIPWRNKSSEQTGTSSLYPVLHVMGSLKEYHRDLVGKEVDSLWELGMVGSSFKGVIQKADHFHDQLENFEQTFAEINGAAGQFDQVRGAINIAVTEAQSKVEELKHTSVEVEKSYSDMEQTFEQLQASVEGIQRCMKKIISIAEQTNILAINASIEAARAGESGR